MQWLNRKLSEEMDRINMKAGVTITRMMELAGLMIAKQAESLNPKKIVCIAGHGHNGGDALCAARHLVNKGHETHVVLVNKELKDESKEQLEILKNMNVKIKDSNECKSFENYDLIIDGLLGYNINRNPEGEYKQLIELANSSGKHIIAIDLPSGVDADGKEFVPAINAHETICLGYPKKGNKNNPKSGEIYVAYLSIVKEVADKLEIDMIDFKNEEIIKI